MTNANMCPLCDYRNDDMLKLSEHLLGHPFGQTGIMLYESDVVRCWCGVFFKPTPFGRNHRLFVHSWALHLERHGGPVAHFLKVSLGIKSDPDATLEGEYE